MNLRYTVSREISSSDAQHAHIEENMINEFAFSITFAELNDSWILYWHLLT